MFNFLTILAAKGCCVPINSKRIETEFFSPLPKSHDATELTSWVISWVISDSHVRKSSKFAKANCSVTAVKFMRHTLIPSINFRRDRMLLKATCSSIVRTMVENSQEYRLKYWATRSSVCLFARNAHSFASSVQLVLLAPSAPLRRAYFFARSLTPELMGKCTVRAK